MHARLILSLGCLLALLGLVPRAHGAIRYLDPACNDNITTYNPTAAAGSRCTGGTANSRNSLTTAWASLAASDTLYIRAGTYAGRMNWTMKGGATPIFPNGTSWTAPTVISAYPITRTCSGIPTTLAGLRACYGSTYERVVIRPTGGGSSGEGILTFVGPARYMHVEGLIADGSISTTANTGIRLNETGTTCLVCSTVLPDGTHQTGPPACEWGGGGTCTGTCTPGSATGGATAPQHIRFLNVESGYAAQQGVVFTDIGVDIQFLNVTSHHAGKSNLHHGFYGSGDVVIDGGSAHHNYGYGYHIYHVPNYKCTQFPIPGATLTNVRSFNNQWGVQLGGAAPGTIVKNAIVYNNPAGGVMISGFGQTLATRIYNSTIFANGLIGINAGGNNLGGLDIRNTIYDGIITDFGPGVPFINTTNYNACHTCAIPDFVNAAAGDFRLRAGDARINAGTNLTSVGVIDDIDGNARPFGGAYDIGAYEFDSAGPPPQSFDFDLVTTLGGEEEDLPVVQGAAVANTVTVTKLAGTAASVVFSATGVPSLATIAFAPTACTPTTTTCTSTATVTTANGTPEGSYEIVVSGTSGALTRSYTFTLTVTCN